MTVHGNQYLLPFFMNKTTRQPSIQGDDELALAFYLLTKDLGKNEKIISFSRLLWPILSIQGAIGAHIMLDGLNLFNKKGKFSNPPRQPLVGHILRNIENRTKTEQLDTLIDILTYKDKEAVEIGEGEESEYHALQIDGLINPEFLQTLVKLIPLIEYRPIVDYTVLDSNITTEIALNISEEYREIINTMKGNAFRWKTQIELIGKESDKWFIDLNVQLKDIKTRYSSQISKASSTIDPALVDDKTKLEQDKIDQWNVEEKKKIIENISTLFKTSERHLEEMIKKNKFFISGDSLKSRVYEDILPHFETQFSYLKDEGKKFLDSLETLYQRFSELKGRAIQIDNEAREKLNKFKESIQERLKDRAKLITEFESEKQVHLSNLESLKNQIDGLYEKIKEIIQIKHNACLQEAQKLVGWSLNDDRSELFSRPIQWIYMPLYAIFIEDEDNIEEYMNIVFPGYIINDPNVLYEDISNAIIDLKNILSEKIENDMAIRSNFEFSCDRKNLIKDSSLKKRIQLGTSKLREKRLLTEAIEEKIREHLNKLP